MTYVDLADLHCTKLEPPLTKCLLLEKLGLLDQPLKAGLSCHIQRTEQSMMARNEAPASDDWTSQQGLTPGLLHLEHTGLEVLYLSSAGKNIN